MKILICVIDKAHSEEATQFAGNLFKVEDPEVTLFSVVVPGSKKVVEQVQVKEKGVLEQMGIKNINLKIKESVDISSAIVEEIKEGNYDLLVIGSRGIGGTIPGVSQYILGDVPREVIPQVEISTLTVPESRPLTKVLICIDGTPGSVSALKFWANLEKKHRQCNPNWQPTRIVLLNVITEFYTRFRELLEPLVETQLSTLQTLPGKRTQYLYDGKALLKEYGLESEIRLREGDVAEEILKEAERDYDLIIMGRSGRKKYTFGPHTRRVVENSKIPVLAIKSG